MSRPRNNEPEPPESEYGRDARKGEFAKATLRYKPATVRVLFIAEAPPAFRFHRLFYFEDLRDGDTLFLEMMKTLYASAVGFTKNGFSSGSSAQGIRSRKSELLARFMREGYFLIDASEEPMPDRASSSQKLALWTVTAHSVVPQGLKPNSLSALCGPTKVGP
jgi:hypothetical protein